MAFELVADLKKLAELHNTGVLGDAEFAAAKNRLLDRYSYATDQEDSGQHKEESGAEIQGGLTATTDEGPPPASGTPLTGQGSLIPPSAPDPAPPPSRPPPPPPPSPAQKVDSSIDRLGWPKTVYPNRALLAAAGVVTVVAVLVLLSLVGGDGPARDQDGQARVSEAGVSVWTDPGGCRVNLLNAENRSGEYRFVETEVGFYHDDQLVKLVGPFAWDVDPGFSGTLGFMLPSDTFEDLPLDVLLEIDCRLLGTSID